MIPLHAPTLRLSKLFSLPKQDYQSKLKALFRETFSKEHVLFTSSARNAIYSALKLMGFDKGDDIMLPGYTGSSVREAVSQVCNPVFLDVDPQTFNLKPEEIKRKMTKHTKAIIVVHMYGNPCDMDAIVTIAKDNGLVIIEDVAQALFARWMGKTVGSFGDFSIFSFNFSKDITSYRGGVLLSNQAIESSREFTSTYRILPQLFTTLSLMTLVKTMPSWLYFPIKKHILFPYFKKQGFKFNISNKTISNYQSYLLYKQFQRMESIIDKRRQNANSYSQRLQDVVNTPRETEGGKHTYYRYTIQTDRRDELADYLWKHGIEADKMYDYFLAPRDTCPNSQRASQCSLNIPVHQDLSPEAIQKVVEAIYRFK
ncbi:DegT/DnrJ/EryC1/StrS family aminotransferase [Chloroflexota bacterium]